MDRGRCVTATLFICILGGAICNLQSPQSPQHQQYQNEESQGYSESDYSDYSSNVVNTIQCYTCHYEIRNGHTSGMEGCDKNKFVEAGIPTVSCSGPCATIFQKLGDQQFLLTRNCVPSCKEHQSDSGITHCCRTSLCNAAIGNFRSTSYVIVAVFCTFLALIF